MPVAAAPATTAPAAAAMGAETLAVLEVNPICFSLAWEVAGTVVAPPSSVVKCLWEVFVWGFGVLFLPCVCVGVGGVVLCRCVGVTC